ncbi:hypothetical protein [Stenotrophomonas sp. DR009]|uniref:hypothetical protein n=1 Tax=Stenotrophomonas sp. DR009 TaxID=3398461 RepID=UPI003BB0C5F2
MTTDNKTLADVQPGGRVVLRDQAERARFEAWNRENWPNLDLSRGPLGDYMQARVRSDWQLWQAALSAQPSPGGQGDARAQFSKWWSQQSCAIGTLLPYEIARLGWNGALAARQPEGEPVRLSSHTVDGDLSVASAIDQVLELFPSSGRAALQTLAGLFTHPTVYRYAAPPAQAVDPAAFKALYRAYVRLLESGRDRITDLGGTCDPVDVMEANDVDLQAARRVMDSQAEVTRD